MKTAFTTKGEDVMPEQATMDIPEFPLQRLAAWEESPFFAMGDEDEDADDAEEEDEF